MVPWISCSPPGHRLIESLQSPWVPQNSFPKLDGGVMGAGGGEGLSLNPCLGLTTVATRETRVLDSLPGNLMQVVVPEHRWKTQGDLQGEGARTAGSGNHLQRD